MSAEDGIADTLRPHADAAGADVNRIHMLTDVAGHDPDQPFDARPWSMPRDLDVLQKLVTISGARLVIIDPLNAVLGSAVDSYRDQDVRGALKPLSRLAEETGAAVVVVRHLTKGGGTRRPCIEVGARSGSSGQHVRACSWSGTPTTNPGSASSFPRRRATLQRSRPP